jgi:hypothetical protein
VRRHPSITAMDWRFSKRTTTGRDFSFKAKNGVGFEKLPLVAVH